jgi:hypothetical protein
LIVPIHTHTFPGLKLFQNLIVVVSFRDSLMNLISCNLHIGQSVKAESIKTEFAVGVYLVMPKECFDMVVIG